MIRTSVRNLFHRLLRQEEAQTTAEYIFILAIVLGVILLVIRDFLRPLLQKLADWIDQSLGDRVFKEGTFHRLGI